MRPWWFCVSQSSKSWQQVHRRSQLIARFSGWNLTRPARHARLAHPAFPGGSFVAAEWAVASGLATGGAIVRREDNQRSIVDARVSQTGQNLADRPVDLFDYVPVQAV